MDHKSAIDYYYYVIISQGKLKLPLHSVSSMEIGLKQVCHKLNSHPNRWLTWS